MPDYWFFFIFEWNFDIVNFGFPQSLENMVYDFMSFKLFSSGYWAISPPRENGGGEIAQLIRNWIRYAINFWNQFESRSNNGIKKTYQTRLV